VVWRNSITKAKGSTTSVMQATLEESGEKYSVWFAIVLLSLTGESHADERPGGGDGASWFLIIAQAADRNRRPHRAVRCGSNAEQQRPVRGDAVTASAPRPACVTARCQHYWPQVLFSGNGASGALLSSSN